MTSVYANENDAKAAHWLSCLPLRFDRIDSRSIVDVKGSDLDGYAQCHFFAGIAGWPLALQLAGWPTDEPVWTGSCPCQPFSAAGKRKGTDDERHLWPEFRRLIAECRPPVVFGEQVASKDGREWLANVRADLEALGYAVGCADLCAAGVGAPHIRQRLFWVAHTDGRDTGKERQQRSREHGQQQEDRGDAGGLVHASNGRPAIEEQGPWLGGPSDTNGLGNTTSSRPLPSTHGGVYRGEESTGSRNGEPERSDVACWLEHSESNGRVEGRSEPIRRIASVRLGEGFWGECDFLYCSDGKYRPVEPRTFPLAHGIPGRVAQLRGLGNAIVPQVASEFIASFMECRE